jgi:hypothetical protein
MDLFIPRSGVATSFRADYLQDLSVEFNRGKNNSKRSYKETPIEDIARAV